MNVRGQAVEKHAYFAAEVKSADSCTANPCDPETSADDESLETRAIVFRMKASGLLEVGG